jgi:hypothetical protein
VIAGAVGGGVYPFEWGQLFVFFVFPRLPLAFISFMRADPTVVFEFGSYWM